MAGHSSKGGKGGQGAAGASSTAQPQPQRQPQQQPPSPSSAATDSTQQRVQEGCGAAKTRHSLSLPLCARPLDLLLVLWFVVYFFTVMISDYHNFTAANMGITTYELRNVDLTPWPPVFITELYLRFCEEADPLLCSNPPFFQAMEYINLLFLLPFSVLAVVAFIAGWNWVRQPAIVSSCCIFFSINICVAESFFGVPAFRSPSPMLYLAMYTPYWVFPLLVILRLWKPHPFCASGSPHWTIKTIILLLSLLTYGYFFVFIGKFFVQHLPQVLPGVL